MDGGGWTPEWNLDTRRELRLRETDRRVYGETKKWPLSVSADSIAMCAMRAVTLLSRLGSVDRVNGQQYEVYPGAALIQWGLATDAVGYKRERDVRELLLDRLAPDGGWLVLGEHRDELARTDHALDALISALVARAAATGNTHDPPADRSDVIAREGWIQLPREGTLETLA